MIMKLLFLIPFAFISLLTFSQADPNPCGALPVANPDTTASTNMAALSKRLNEAVSGELKTGEHQAVFKLMVLCTGTVSKLFYQQGNLSEEFQKKFHTVLAESKWSPAVHQQEKVSSMVFVTIRIVNGKINLVVK